MEFIGRATATGSVSSLIVSSIPNTYKTLKVLFNVAESGTPLIVCNGDTGSNYASRVTRFDGITYSSGLAINTSTALNLTSMGQANVASVVSSGIELVIERYAGNRHKVMSILGTTNYQAGNDNTIIYGSGIWASTAAINSITLSSGTGLGAGSSISVYGII